MTVLKYVGHDRNGTVVGPPWVKMPYGEPVDLPADLAKALLRDASHQYEQVTKPKKDDA